MVRSWAAGADTGPDGAPLLPGRRWQAELWRSVRQQIAVPSFPELLPSGLDPIRTGSVDLDLPLRVMVYGLTAIDPLDLDVLVALAAAREVYLFVLSPSPALWTAETARNAEVPSQPLLRSRDRSGAVAEHPLLRSWAQESREFQVVLGSNGLHATPVAARRSTTGSVLGRLQDDVRANRAAVLDEALAAAVAGGKDRSIQVHACHGDRRQVEVLRDAILHVLTADPTLEPRDIVVMTPDLATFAPLLEGAFPAGDAALTDGGLPDLRLRIADRSPAATNPLVRFAATVLDLADSRLEAGMIRDLVAKPVVQQRFGFDAEASSAIVGVIDDTNVRWGFDAGHRRAWGAGHNPERTWRRALDRALAGVFAADGAVRTIGDVAPLDGVEGQEAVPVALLASIMDRVAAIRELLGGEMPLSRWSAAISSAVRMLAAPAWGDEWQWTQLERLLGDTFPRPNRGGADPVVALPDARRAIAAWAEDRPSPLHFQTGNVTVCTLVPMRSVPYRVVCLLGMDDDRFPRTSRADGDDLLVGHEVVGDLDRAAQDRQLLLDAVMAAGDHLIVTYSGKDELTAAAYPPAVPIVELSDTLTAMVGRDAVEALRTEHPLQAFADANFTPDVLNTAGPWGFDPMQLAAAEAVHRRHDDDDQEVAQWPAWADPTEIRLDDLVAFLQHPSRRFIRARVGFTVPKRGDISDDSLPVTLDSLGAWGVTDRLVKGLLAGHDVDALLGRERSSDALPPGDLAAASIEKAVAGATAIAAAASARNIDPASQRPWSGVVDLGERSIEGSVVADPAQAHLTVVTASRIKASTRLKAFAELAFLTALEPATAWEAILIGRRDKGEGHMAVTISSLGKDPEQRRSTAHEILAGLVELYVEGHQLPLPIPCETAFAWQRRVGSDRNQAADRAREKWEGRFSEAVDPAHELLFPHLASTDLLIAEFAGYCERLWGPLLWRMRERPV